MWAETEQRPHSAQELFDQAVVESETIDELIKRMPERMQAVLNANGEHTKW